jgi:hypothetical protein
MCAHKLFSKEFDFKDRRARTRYAIMITNKGAEYVKELIHDYLHIWSFLISWYIYKSKDHSF